MLILTAKLPRRKLALSVAAAALVCCAALVLTLGTPAARQAAASALPDPKGVKTNEDRRSFLQSYGWQLSEEPTATEELLIPEEMDESYDDYLAMQKAQGFDLEKYAGKRVKRYTYEVTNYPTGEQGILVNLLIYKNTVVAGEMLSPLPDGFLHGLEKP